MFNVGDKVTVIHNLKEDETYDGCWATSRMVRLSGKEVEISRCFKNAYGKPRYHIIEDGERYAWSENMFIPKEKSNKTNWFDKII